MLVRPQLPAAPSALHSSCVTQVSWNSRLPLVGRRPAVQPLQPRVRPSAPCRGAPPCQAAKKGGKGGAKKKQGGPTAKVQQQKQAPAAAPASGGISTKERSKQRQQADQAQPHEEDQQEQQHQAAAQQQPAEAEAVPATPNIEEPGMPADVGEQMRQQPVQPEARTGPLETPGQFKRLQREAAPESKKPNFAEGVLQEIRLIEWPTLSSALLNTVLVIAIVAGLSLLLFVVNLGLTKGSEALYGLSSKSSSSGATEQPAQPAASQPAPAQPPQPDAAAEKAPPPAESSAKPDVDPKSSFPDLL